MGRKEVFKRVIMAECNITLGKVVLMVLWDIEKFFDSINPVE